MAPTLPILCTSPQPSTAQDPASLGPTDPDGSQISTEIQPPAIHPPLTPPPPLGPKDLRILHQNHLTYQDPASSGPTDPNASQISTAIQPPLTPPPPLGPKDLRILHQNHLTYQDPASSGPTDPNASQISTAIQPPQITSQQVHWGDNGAEADSNVAQNVAQVDESDNDSNVAQVDESDNDSNEDQVDGGADIEDFEFGDVVEVIEFVEQVESLDIPRSKDVQRLLDFLEFIKSTNSQPTLQDSNPEPVSYKGPLPLEEILEHGVKAWISEYISFNDAISLARGNRYLKNLVYKTFFSQNIIELQYENKLEKDQEKQEITQVYEEKMTEKLQVIFNAPTEKEAREHFKSFEEEIESFFNISLDHLPNFNTEDDDIQDLNIGFVDLREIDPWMMKVQSFFSDKLFNRQLNDKFRLIDNSLLFAVKKLLDQGVDSQMSFLLDFSQRLFSYFCTVKNRQISDEQKKQYCFNDPWIKETYHYCIAKLDHNNQHDMVETYLNIISDNSWRINKNVSDIEYDLGRKLIKFGPTELKILRKN